MAPYLSAHPPLALMRLASLALALLLVPAALAQDVIDPQTGEPVPLGLSAPPDANETAAARGGGELVPTSHLPAGGTKLVRTLPGGLVAYMDGAQLIVGEGSQAALQEVARIDLPALPSDAFVDGERLYVAFSKSPGLAVYDLAGLYDGDPATDAEEVGRADLPSAFAVLVDGETLYLGRGTTGVSVHDADPSSLAQVAFFNTPGSANGLGLYVEDISARPILVVADGNVTSGDDVRLYDVSDPATPTALGSVEANGFATFAEVVYYGSVGVAFVTGAAGLIAIDLASPESPTVLDVIPLGSTTYEVVIDRPADRAYVNGLAGARAIDISDPADLTEVAAYNFGGQGLTIAAEPEAGLVYAGDRFGGLRVLDAATLDELYRIENGGFAHKPFFGEVQPEGGRRLYVTDLAGRLRTFDVSPANEVTEVLEARIAVPTNTQEVVVAGDVAFVTHAAGLSVFDVSSVPYTQLADVATQQSYGLALQDDVLYVANGFGGLLVLDVSDPAAPEVLSSTAVGSNVVDVDVTEFPSVAYIVSFGGGMLSFDISDPAAPAQLDAEPTFGFLNALDVDRDYGVGLVRDVAYVADGQNGLRVVNLEDPADLVSLSTTPVATQARDVSVGFIFYGDAFAPLVHVADDFFGLQEFEIETGQVRSFESADRGIGVVALNEREPILPDLVVLAAGEAGVYVFEAPFFTADEPTAGAGTLRLATAPNPARGTTRVSFELGAPTPVEASVYDVLGRRVATLAEGAHAAGPHALDVETAGWAPGVYTVRVRAGEAVATQRLTVVR